jgi:hypothetical protein
VLILAIVGPLLSRVERAPGWLPDRGRSAPGVVSSS